MSEITKADLLWMFVEGASIFEGRMRNCALKALNKHLGLFRGHRGEFTTAEATKLLEAADRYMANPVNHINLTGPILVSEGGRREYR